ncbi:MAG: cytosine permease [Candidatus Aminicenantes bacterium]|nr:MAG: cytosine permease [Candidatus Aminicenantes bacterium]
MQKPRESSQIFEDFSLQSVPLNQRKKWINLAVIWIGIAVVMSAIFRGMMIGLGLGKISSVIISYILGEIILIGMMGFAGYIGAQTGFSTPLIANFSFGRIGAILVSLCIAFSLIGWFGVQAAFFARTIQFYFGTNFSLPVFSFLCGILMMIPAIFGIRGLSVLSWVASPFMIVIFIWGIIKMGFQFLPSETLISLAINHQPDPYPITLGTAASIVAGGFIVGATTSADIFRYARPRFKDIFLAASIAMVVSAFLHLVGSVLAMNTGVYHERLPELIIDNQYLGLGFIGFLVLLLAQWTTNDSNIYSSVLALNNIFRTKRWIITIIAGVVASLFAAFGILEMLGTFLTILTVSIGPIGGIFICDYYFLRRMRKYDFKGKAFSKINYKALGVYLVAFLIGWTTSGHPFTIKVFPFSIFAFNGILSSIILYYAVMKIFPDKE